MGDTTKKPEVSELEEKYRRSLFPDVSNVVKMNLLCTSCNISVKEKVLEGSFRIHRFFETLLCQRCHDFYDNGEFSADEDGSDKYCRWCGQGGTLFLCSRCPAGFCKRCIKRNLPRNILKEVQKDVWECFCCDVRPLYELRALCWAAKAHVMGSPEKKNDGPPESGGKLKRGRKPKNRNVEFAETPVSSLNKKSRYVDDVKPGEKCQKSSSKEIGGGVNNNMVATENFSQNSAKSSSRALRSCGKDHDHDYAVKTTSGPAKNIIGASGPRASTVEVPKIKELKFHTTSKINILTSTPKEIENPSFKRNESKRYKLSKDLSSFCGAIHKLNDLTQSMERVVQSVSSHFSELVMNLKDVIGELQTENKDAARDLLADKKDDIGKKMSGNKDPVGKLKALDKDAVGTLQVDDTDAVGELQVDNGDEKGHESYTFDSSTTPELVIDEDVEV